MANRASLCFLVLLAASNLARAATILENFNDVTTLPGSGWVLTNNSLPAGSTSWFQGNPGVFPAQSGAPSAYIAANYLNAELGGNVSTWLLTPVLPLANGGNLSFYTRTEAGLPFPDRMEVRLSTMGSSSDVGATDTSVGDFGRLLLTINPLLSQGGYPENWTMFSVVLNGFSGPVTGRYAFRYVVPDTNTNANYIGIDTVMSSQSQVPEPATLISLGLGAAGLLLWRRIGGKMFRHSSRYPAAVVAAVLALGTAALCPAGESGKKAAPKAPAAAAKQKAGTPAPATGGMRVFKDPVTGKIREPEQEEIQQLSPTARTARFAVQAGTTIAGPKGAVGMKLDESQMVYSVATKKADGTVSFECVDGKANADKAVSRKAAPRRQPDVR